MKYDAQCYCAECVPVSLGVGNIAVAYKETLLTSEESEHITEFLQHDTRRRYAGGERSVRFIECVTDDERETAYCTLYVNRLAVAHREVHINVTDNNG